MPNIIVNIDKATSDYFANRFRIHQSTGGKLLYGDYVGQFISNLVDEIEVKK